MEVYLKATRPIRAELNPYLSPFPKPPPPSANPLNWMLINRRYSTPSPPEFSQDFLTIRRCHIRLGRSTVRVKCVTHPRSVRDLNSDLSLQTPAQ